ncbi:MAG TPA: M14 family metallopeptidase [Gaiellaceae bacterium]
MAPATFAAPDGAASASASPQIKRFVVHGVYTREQRSLLVREGFDIGEGYWADHVELYGTVAQARALSLRGMRTTLSPFKPDDFPPPDSNYHNYAEMVADLQAVAAARPNIVHLFSLGTSYEGRQIVGARVSDDATDNLSEPGVFYVGQHHAREHLTVEVVLSLLHMFAGTTPVATSEVGHLVHTRQIYIVPSLNPDGSEYDIAAGSYRFWRKNRQPNGTGQPVGTDNNRNYSYRWGCCGGSDGDPGGETYRGASPMSAPENQRMRDFMIAHPNVTTGISFHSNAELVLYPYGYTFTDEPPDMDHVDHLTFMAMAAEMQRTTGYTAQQSSDLYITDGDWNDWMYGELHRYPITMEISGYGFGFYPPDEYIPIEAKRDWRAALLSARIADCPRRIVGASCG